jgi:hypothetical protein
MLSIFAVAVLQVLWCYQTYQNFYKDMCLDMCLFIFHSDFRDFMVIVEISDYFCLWLVGSLAWHREKPVTMRTKYSPSLTGYLPTAHSPQPTAHSLDTPLHTKP